VGVARLDRPVLVRNARIIAGLRRRSSHLCDRNAVTHNPVKGIERPTSETGPGKTPAIGDHQARKLLAAPSVTCPCTLARTRPSTTILTPPGTAEDDDGALFRPVRNNRTGRLERAITTEPAAPLCASLLVTRHRGS
jgi:hypothetical protein